MPSRHKSLPAASRGRSANTTRENAAQPLPSVPVAEVLSFLKETRGVPSWNIREMANSLGIGRAEAKRVTALLQAQGYIEPSGPDEWLTTISGEAVSGSKAPRFTPEAVEQGLSALADRVKAVNKDFAAPFRIAKAVAFGDFLPGRTRVQAAEVGVELLPRGTDTNGPNSAIAQASRRDFLRRLKAKSSVVSPRIYEEWMSSRTHLNLLEKFFG